MADRLYSFVGGEVGEWAVTGMTAVTGKPLESVSRLQVRNGDLAETTSESTWVLRGVTSHQRYTTRAERDALVANQPALGRPEATCAVFIPISKSTAWWELAQDERRDIFAADAVHTSGALKYLPAIARRLHHGRDLGEQFDFLTWFEFAPQHTEAFDELLHALRASQEWEFVVHEVEIRVEHAS
ncbi:chlorite dismutase family protein [Calycomorphotria hydatis]|uniref:Chlorite dismutase n=1 Tax=Calycomorphotria hydatis TaxID=2528027 RepID=A0A517TF76_9PLAN|nr:chlorite dismutase family protein [Calycomorphotria hydatis]QDT67025.1 Chlorite dismutase precursor [Calycomorphotria hydatis]